MLKSVEIKNFRSCEATTLELGRSLCAIFGRNGVGKSNILKAIEWAAHAVTVADGIRIGPAGNEGRGLDEVAIRFRLLLSGVAYDYRLAVPSPRRQMIGLAPNRPLGLEESLRVQHVDGSFETVFERRAEEILVRTVPGPIQIPGPTPALAALHSLLAADNPGRMHVDRVFTFFKGVGYYTLDDGADSRSYVTEDEYEEWKLRYRSYGILTDSVIFRLIYLSQVEPEVFDELLQIIGPTGLNVVRSFKPNRSIFPNTRFSSEDTAVSVTTLFAPRFWPSIHKREGAGFPVSFSDLSVGTRRVIRVITSMLFDKRSLMLIEQLEDSIHPGLLRKLVDTLRVYSSESQMLITTHSPEVLDVLDPEDVLLVTAPDGVTEVGRLSPSQVAGAKEFLKHEGSLSEFLEPLDAP